ncbi:TonB-dependent receptor [Mucilaginibacter gynuensis]|uniref:TonB-dependent receptor n=1 Tax=Mucilaginibacter gynuensis TaxID=1302236 RepID=A0ABP8FQK6_9SPHI
MKSTVYICKQIRLSKWVALLLVLYGADSYAQTDTTKNLKEVKINSSAAPKVQTFSPAQQVTAADFKRYSAFNVADAVRNFAGVNVRDYGGIGGLKTVSVRSMGANHTAVLYDGVQLTDAQNGQIDLGKFNLNNVQEIALYNAQPPEICMTARAFASASVLSIKTVRPGLSVDKPYQVQLGLKGGSFGLINPYLQWQQRISDDWSFIVNSYYQKANGRYKFKVDDDASDTLAIRKNSDIAIHQVDGALYWAKSDSNRFHIQFNYYNSERGLPGAFIYYVNNSYQRLRNEDVFVQAGYERVFTNGFHLLLNTKASRGYQHYLDTSFVNTKGELSEHYTQREIYQSVSLAYRILPEWEVSYSSDGSVADLKSDVYAYAFPTQLQLYNVLATDVTLGKWHLQGNVLHRYIGQSVKEGKAPPSRSAFLPTVMLSVQPFNKQNLQLRAFYKRIFRNPTFSEEYYYTTLPRVIKPEYTNQYNFGFTYSKVVNSLIDYVTFTADAYYNNITDKIIYLPGRSAEIPAVINLGKVDIKGLDVNLKSQLNLAQNCKGIFSVAYTYQRAQNVTNPSERIYLDQIPYTPKHLLSANAGVLYNKLGVYYNHTFSSVRYTSNNIPEYMIPAYNISDASVVYNFTYGKLPVSLSAEANNLFNKNYSVIKYYPMPGRSFRLTFQLTI